MAFRRTAIRQFSLANSAYKNAVVTFYLVDGDTLTASTDLATIYTSPSGSEVAANPYTLDSNGKTTVPLYADVPIVAAVSQSSIPNHQTGLIYPAITGFKGDWASDVDYLVGDIIRDHTAGADTDNLYISLDDHTSGVWATDLAAGKWQLVVDVASITNDAITAAVAATTAYFDTGTANPTVVPDATGTDSMAIGNKAVTNGTRAMALGNAYASGEDSFAAQNGDNSGTYGALGDNSIVIGAGFSFVAADVGAGSYNAIIAGVFHEISGVGSSYNGILGGRFCSMTGASTFFNGSIGGDFNTFVGGWNGVCGGRFHAITGDYNGACGGTGDITGSASAQVGGTNATISGSYAAVIGGSNAEVIGDYSVIIGGTNADVIGDRSVAIAANGGIFGDGSVLIGGLNGNVNSDYSVIIGGGNSETDTDFSTIIGSYSSNIYSGQYGCIIGGYSNQVDSDYASAFGYGSYARLRGMRAFANGYVIVPPNNATHAQGGEVCLTNKTTDATPTELFLDYTTATKRLDVPSGYVLTFEIQIAAVRTDSGNEAAGYKIQGCIKNSGGTTAFVGGTPTPTVIGEDTAGWDVAVAADNTNDALTITVTGENAKTINWLAVVRWAELTKI